jgi:hypothetical protein
VHTRKPDRQDKASAKLVAIVAPPSAHHTVSSGRRGGGGSVYVGVLL